MSDWQWVPADSAHRGGTRPMPPKLIVLHATAGTDSLSWLTTNPASAVSSHVLIRRDGHIYRLVEDQGVAWHAGPARLRKYGGPGQPNVNNVSFGIELENLNDGVQPYPAVQLVACARVIVAWWGLYGFLPLLAHAAIQSNKTDPRGLHWYDLWEAIRTQLTPYQ